MVHVLCSILLPLILLSFCWSSFISLLMFRLSTTCSSVSLFLASTPSFRSGNFCLYFIFRGFMSSMNFSCWRSKGAVSSYSFRNIFYSFLQNWLWAMCYFTRQLSDSIFLRLSGILKLVLCLFVFFSTFLPSSCSPTTSPSMNLSLFTDPNNSTRFSMSCEQTSLSFCRICFTFGILRIYSFKDENLGQELYLPKAGLFYFFEVWVSVGFERFSFSEKFIILYFIIIILKLN